MQNAWNNDLTFVNIWTVKRGNAAATADRITVFAAKADALYILIKKAVRHDMMHQQGWCHLQVSVHEITLPDKIVMSEPENVLEWYAYQERHENQADARSNNNGAEAWNIPGDASIFASPAHPKYSNNEKRAA